MGRLIGFILIFVVFLTFIISNSEDENICDISFGFTTIKNVPVFITAFSSFVLGMICAVPFVFILGRKKQPPSSKPPRPFKAVPGKSDDHPAAGIPVPGGIPGDKGL